MRLTTYGGDEWYAGYAKINPRYCPKIDVRNVLGQYRAMEASLAKLDPATDQRLHELGDAELTKLAQPLQHEINHIEYLTCHCDKCGGSSRPSRFGGHACNCP